MTAGVEVGLDGLSMSAVAERLGVQPQSLYRHVPSRDALVTLVVDRLVAGWHLPPDVGQPLAEWLWDFASTARSVLLAHPGLDESDAFLVGSTLVNVTVSSVLRQRRLVPTPERYEAYMSELSMAVDELVPADIPHLTTAYGDFAARKPDDFYEFTVRSLIDGMLSRVALGRSRELS